MKNLNEITATVREYLDDSAAVVTQPILDSVNFLSNLFKLDLIDTSQSTAVDGTTLNIPTNGLEIETVFLAGEEVLPLENQDDLETVRINGVQRWYVHNDKIQFTVAFTAIEAAKIWYKKGFKEPEAAVDTDVPMKLIELVYLGAQYRYYNKLIAKIAVNKEDMPDISARALRLVRDDIKKSYFEQITIIQTNDE